MPQCKKCGKSYSIWKFDPRLPVCPECQDAAMAEELKDSFPCLVPNAPLTKSEQVGTLGMGMVLGMFRTARIKLGAGQLHLSALDFHGRKIELAKLPIRPGDNALLTPMRVSLQLRVAFGRTLIFALGIGVLIVAAIIMDPGIKSIKDLLLALAISATVGVVLAGLIILLPALFMANPETSVVDIRTQEGLRLVLALKRKQIPEALAVLSRAGLMIRKTQEPASSAVPGTPY